MSRFALLVLGGVLATHLAIFAATAAQQSRQDKNIDLTELTPSLESQLYEAKRLNRADSESPPLFELNKLAAPDDEQSYELLAGSQDGGGGDGGPGRMVSLVRDPTAAASNWLDRARLTPNNLARRSNERATAQANYNNNNNNNDRGSSRGGGLNSVTGQAAAAAGARSQGSSPLIMLSQRSSLKQAAQQPSAEAAAAQAWARDTNRDYDDLNGLQLAAATTSAIGNHESASRGSLWTSDLLRDLLIAREARTRARYLDQMERNYELERAKNSAASNGGSSGNSKNGWFWQTNRRDKRRRCKVDPNLGVKNPSFCDTDAYFGAADYGTRDVWGDAGR